MDYSETVPFQYETGKERFMGMDISVDRRVFIPRPETELLVNVVAKLCREGICENPLILDVGTGSGIIPLGLTQLIDKCRVVAVDISLRALMVAAANIRKFRRENKVRLLRSDMFEAFKEECEEIFDVIVSNPPYVSAEDYEKVDVWVKAEPKIALYGGDDGMEQIRRIAEESGKFLKKGGLLAMEVGYDQGKKVKDMLGIYGFKNVTGYHDFNGYERVIVAWKPGEKEGDRGIWTN